MSDKSFESRAIEIVIAGFGKVIIEFAKTWDGPVDLVGDHNDVHDN
jgi:hypothetical protein